MNIEIYDTNNIFARILRGEIPCKKVFESEHALAFHDINPQAPVHVLVIPKGPYINFAEFTAKATEAEIVDFFKAAREVAAQLGLIEPGFRGLFNNGVNGHQEVPHFHLHLFGGKKLGPMLVRD